MRIKKLMPTFCIAILLCSNVALAAERREVAAFTVFGTPSSSQQQEQVGSLLEAFKETWARQDVEAHLALFTEDTEWINAYARMFRGTEELNIFLRDQLFPAFDSEVSQQEIRNANLISIRYLNDTAAVAHLYTDGARGDSTIPGRELRRTHIHLVFNEIDGKWLIAHTAIMDARN